MSTSSPLFGDISSSFSLNSIIFGFFFYSSTLRDELILVVGTLRASLSSIAVNVRMISTLFSIVAISKIELYRPSPACNEGIFDVEDFDNMDKISVTTYYK